MQATGVTLEPTHVDKLFERFISHRGLTLQLADQKDRRDNAKEREKDRQDYKVNLAKVYGGYAVALAVLTICVFIAPG